MLSELHLPYIYSIGLQDRYWNDKLEGLGQSGSIEFMVQNQNFSRKIA